MEMGRIVAVTPVSRVVSKVGEKFIFHSESLWAITAQAPVNVWLIDTG